MRVNVEQQLNHHEARDLFFDAVDGALPATDTERLERHLEDCASCRSGFQQYSSTVLRVRNVPRENAPPTLAAQILRRLRRKRPSSMRGQWLTNVHHRLPVELILPLIVAAAAAVWLLLTAS